MNHAEKLRSRVDWKYKRILDLSPLHFIHCFVFPPLHLVNEIHKKAQSNPVRLMVCWVAKLGLTCQLSDNFSGTSTLIKVPAFDVNQRRIKPQITINQASWSIATSALSSFFSLLIHISVSSLISITESTDITF